jgi:hypothetical protein
LISKGKILKAVGWTTIGIGVYLVSLGIHYDGDSVNIKPKYTKDDIIDAEFTIIED